MNVAIIFLIVIVILIFIGIIILLLKNNVKNQTIGTGSGTISSSHCTPNKTTIPDLSSTLCCVIFGTLTSNKYLSSLDMVVSLEPTNYLDVCAGFCTQGYDSTLNTCNGDVQQDIGLFNQCVQNTNPAILTCSDKAVPVATSNGEYMYGFAATNVLCPQTGTCALTL